jgi:hypothetical protein
MASGPIALLKPTDLQFVAEPSGFADLLAGELGNLGTSQDGFSEIFDEAAILASEAGSVLASFDSHLADAGIILPAFDNTGATDQAALLQPAADATDAALNEFNQLVPPTPTTGTAKSTGCAPGSVHGGLTIGKTDPNPYPKVSVNPPYTYMKNYPVMCTDNAKVVDTVVTGMFSPSDGNTGTAELISGDPAIFSFALVKRNDLGSSWLEDVVLTITPAKAGRFTAVIYYDRSGGNQFGGHHTYAYNVTIVKP